jgi:hypothetical protein
MLNTHLAILVGIPALTRPEATRFDMPTNDLTLALITCGLGLTLIYVVSEIVQWATIKAANRRALIEARRLYRQLYSATVGTGSNKVTRTGTTTHSRG